MVTPEGVERWAVRNTLLLPQKRISRFYNRLPMRMKISNCRFRLGPEFQRAGWKTKVSISIYNESLERMERMTAGGFFREGTMGQLKNLEDLLATLKQEPNTKATNQ
jgi:hypothetical protein